MTRRCSHCSNNGHNSRTCPTRGAGACGGGGGGSAVKLFGVRLTDGSIIKKSASMGNLPALAAAAARLRHSPSSPNGSHNHDSLFSDHAPDPNHAPDGYLSDDPDHCSEFSLRPGDKKKGVPWTEEEHRLFLTGLSKLGKGDWRGIARNYVVSRTPTQVASHAQKYFLHRTNSTRRKRRSSLFDMVPDDITVRDTSLVQEELNLLPSSKLKEPDKANCPISLDLSLKTLESEPTAVSAFEPIKEHEERVENATVFSPTFVPSYFPAPCTFWRPTATASPLGDHQQALENHPQHLVIVPTTVPVFAGKPVNVEELVGISQLSIGEVKNSHREPSPLSLKLIGQSTKTSSFHGNSSDLRKDHSVIHAV